jgi:hypothetical protein
MKHRLLTGLALAPLTLAVLTDEPANADSGMRVTPLPGAQGWRVSASDAGEGAISGTVDDPVRRDGSLRLNNLAGGARAQAQLPLGAPLQGTSPEQNGDLTPGVPGRAGGRFAAARQPVSVEMAAAVSEPTKQAADSFGMLAGGMVAAAVAAFAGTAMVRRKDVRR